MKSFEEFMGQFRFDPEKGFMVGVERECILKNGKGEIVPIAKKILDYLGMQNGHFGYELSACQLEWRIGPCLPYELKKRLIKDEVTLKKTEKKLGFTRSFIEVAPDDMPLDVFPDPPGRYQRIVKTLPKRVLLAACQVIATHVHIGMPDPKTALRVYNSVIKHMERLCRMGDHSSGKRLEVYKIMAPKYLPPRYKTWKDFYNLSMQDGFTDDPRSCWHLIRISVNGTIEFRMFGATTDLDEIVSWTNFCHNLCQGAIK